VQSYGAIRCGRSACGYGRGPGPRGLGPGPISAGRFQAGGHISDPPTHLQPGSGQGCSGNSSARSARSPASCCDQRLCSELNELCELTSSTTPHHRQLPASRGSVPYKDPEQRRESLRKWRAANREELRAASGKWRAANLDQVRETNRACSSRTRCATSRTVRPHYATTPAATTYHDGAAHSSPLGLLLSGETPLPPSEVPRRHARRVRFVRSKPEA
jgi:hypothetical protein